MTRIALALTLLVVTAFPALAQDAAQPSEFAQFMTNYVWPVIIPLVVGLLSAVAVRLLKAIGINIEANHREAFQTALGNAAALLAQGHSLKEAFDYLRRSAGDAMNYFTKHGADLSEPALAEKLEAKVAQLPAPPIPVPNPVR